MSACIDICFHRPEWARDAWGRPTSARPPASTPRTRNDRGVATIRRETELDAPAERVWQAMLQPSTMLYVLKGLFSFPALDGRIDPIVEGEGGTGWTLLFHVIPFARWTITVLTVDAATHTISTEERGGIMRRWDHTLHVEALDDHRSLYRDTIVIDAGLFTRVAAPVVGSIFAYRQRRLRLLARRHLARRRNESPLAT